MLERLQDVSEAARLNLNLRRQNLPRKKRFPEIFPSTTKS
jgi:hypothetical protein